MSKILIMPARNRQPSRADQSRERLQKVSAIARLHRARARHEAQSQAPDGARQAGMPAPSTLAPLTRPHSPATHVQAKRVQHQYHPTGLRKHPAGTPGTAEAAVALRRR